MRARMNKHTQSPNGIVPHRTSLDEHFATIEAILADLREKVDNSRAATKLAEEPRQSFSPEQRVDLVRQMLGRLGSVTASEVQRETGISHTTAMRVLHTLARGGEGIMVFEPAGPTFRIRLWHPDRVILDHVVR
jgi:hypothetical protein